RAPTARAPAGQERARLVSRAEPTLQLADLFLELVAAAPEAEHVGEQPDPDDRVGGEQIGQVRHATSPVATRTSRRNPASSSATRAVRTRRIMNHPASMASASDDT